MKEGPILKKLGETKFAGKIANWFERFMKKYFDSQTLSYHTVLSIYIPLLIDQAFVSMMTVVNSSMVSSSGAEAVSAVSMVDSLNFFLMNFFIAIATGGTVVVAQYIGKGDRRKASRTISQAVASSVLIAIVVAVVIIVFSKQTLALLFGKAEQLVMDNALIYLIGSCISYPFYAVYQASSGALRGLGDTKASMMMSIAMNVICLIGNVIFINIMGLGVLGVSISMIISRVCVSIFSLLYLIFKRTDLKIQIKDFLTIDTGLQKSILYIGIPAGTEQLFFNGGKILVQTFVVMLGTMSITANAIGMNLMSMWQIPANAIQLASITIAGQCVGAGRPDEARKYLHSLNRTARIVCLIMIIILWPLTPWILGFFNPPDEARTKILFLMIFPVIGLLTTWAPSFITPSILRAAGDAKFTTIAALISVWTVRVGLGYVLAIVCGLDIYGVWLAMILEWGSRAAVFTWRFKGDKWEHHKFIN